MSVMPNLYLPHEALVLLLQHETCIRCCLRIGGNYPLAKLFSQSDKELKAEFLAHCLQKNVDIKDLSDTATIDSVCVCCLNVCSDQFARTTALQIKEKLEQEEYETKSFTLSFKVEGAIMLREYVLGHFIRTQLQYDDFKAPLNIKEVFKYYLNGPISEAIGIPESPSSSDFHVIVDIVHSEAAAEVMQLPSLSTNNSFRRRGKLQSEIGCGIVLRALAALHNLPESIQCPPVRLFTGAISVIQFERDPLYVRGRYLKHKRGVSQSCWIIEGERMAEKSVEECIGTLVLPLFRGSGYKFHSAGREDVDVRMLGNGRPFIIEILNAKNASRSKDQLDQLEKAINKTNEGLVEVRDIQLTNKEYFTCLQNGADTKKKTYCCVIWSKAEITPEKVDVLTKLSDLKIDQMTPIRVLHRRTLMNRCKIIHQINCEIINKHYMIVRLTTSAGTYVKEFIHGDRGRTQPNLSTYLGSDTDILQLDVENLLEL